MQPIGLTNLTSRGKHLTNAKQAHAEMRIETDQLLGMGAYGQVEAVVYRHVGLARKRIISRRLAIEHLREEAHVMERLDHAHIVRLVGTYRALGRDDDSARTLQRGVERFPEYAPLRVFQALTAYNQGRARDAVQALVEVLLESTSDATVLRYRRSLSAYARDLDRSWLQNEA